MKKLTLFSSLAAAATVAALVLFGSCENPTDAEKSTPVDPATLKNITSFSFTSPAATGTVSASTIAVTVPFGTDVTALVATFTTNGESVKVGDVAQVSGTTVNNFTNPVTYTVTAKDASTKTFVVTVTVAPEDTSPKVDISKVWMGISIYPRSEGTTSSATFDASCQVYDADKKDYKNIEFKINGVSIPFGTKEPYGNMYSATLGTLNTGDTITISIRDADLGTHTFTSSIPSSLSDISLTPALVPGTPATETAYTISWEALPDIQKYEAIMGSYTIDGNIVSTRGSGTSLTGTSISILKTDSTFAEYFGKEWIYFEVSTIKDTNITGFMTGSHISIQGTLVQKKTNYVPAD